MKASLNDIRKEQYYYNRSSNSLLLYGLDLNDWKKHPYTFLKSRYYMEMSSLLVYFLLKTKIKPNLITAIYAFSGILGGLFLSINNVGMVIAAIFIFFNKGILDWSDGHYARKTNQTSFTGHIFDSYGGLINSLGFQIGLGIYVANYSSNIAYVYLTVVLVFFYASRVRSYTSNHVINEVLKGDIKIKSLTKIIDRYNNKDSDLYSNPQIKNQNMVFKYIKILFAMFDDRARSVDLICFIIVLELVFQIYITWLILIYLTVKSFIYFLGDLYLFLAGGWMKNLEEIIDRE